MYMNKYEEAKKMIKRDLMFALFYLALGIVMCMLSPYVSIGKWWFIGPGLASILLGGCFYLPLSFRSETK